MKQLIIPEQYEIDIGSYGPACEGFVDLIKGFFKKKDPIAERLEILKKDKWQSFGGIKKTLEQDLKSTYDNQGWVEKNLPDAKGMITIKALSHANVHQKQITSPEEVVKVALSMLSVVKEIAHAEKPFTELRRKIISQIENVTDPTVVDQVWLDNEKQLKTTAAERHYQRNKKALPALGGSNKPGEEWPVGSVRKGEFGFTEFNRYVTSGEFEAPSISNAKDFAIAVRKLVEICCELDTIYKESYIEYWECLAVEYDALKYGDEVYTQIASGQSGEVYHLASTVAYDIGRIIVGFYIAMFDKQDKSAN